MPYSRQVGEKKVGMGVHIKIEGNLKIEFVNLGCLWSIIFLRYDTSSSSVGMLLRFECVPFSDRWVPQ